MTSIAAQEVAKEVLENIGKGKRPNLGKIARKKGYAIHTADNPKLITETKSFKEVVNPIVQRWLKQRERLTAALETKDLTDASLRDTIDAIDKITKNIQLLTGGATENYAVIATIEEKEAINKAIDEI